MLCKQRMDIAGQKLDERIYFWHAEILFKKVPFYVYNVDGCRCEVCMCYIYIRLWRSLGGNELKSQLS